MSYCCDAELFRRWRAADILVPSPRGRAWRVAPGEGADWRRAFNPTSMSFSVRLPGGRVTFSCMAKRKSPKGRPPRCCAFRPSLDEEFVRPGRVCRRAVPGAAASGRNPFRPPCGPGRPSLTAAQGARLARIVRAGLGSGGCSTSLRSRPWMAVIEAVQAPLHGAEHRSAKREQGANVRTQGCAPKSAGTAELNAAGGPERKQGASHRGVASRSRPPAWREKRRVVEPTRGRRDRHAGRSGFGCFPRNESNLFGGSRTELFHGARAEPLFGGRADMNKGGATGNCTRPSVP